jgi:PIN domain nuclease of toxin-antitoxin system
MQDDDSISRDVEHILRDYSNRFYVSSVAVRELIHAYKTNGIKDSDIKSVKFIFEAMENLGIEIVPMNKHHLLKYADLETAAGHKDPNDHIIISQAIADKIPIISSDRKFKEYTGQGFAFVYNRR